jgi:hypothetical protein
MLGRPDAASPLNQRVPPRASRSSSYYYLVEGRREGKTVRQRVIKYLGKRPITAHTGSAPSSAAFTIAAWQTFSPVRFRPIIRKDYQTVFTNLLMSLADSAALPAS